MKKSGSQDSQTVVTFVSEGATHAVDFTREPHRKLAAIGVSQCHILEITNRDEQRKRTVMSLSHFMVIHLLSETNLNQSIQTVIRNFIQEGGNINDAEFRIYGGVEGQNSILRGALKKQLIQKGIQETKIYEPKGHEAKEANKANKTHWSNNLLHSEPEGESTDYLFDRDGVTFRKITLASLSSDDESSDEVSRNLKNEKGEFDKSKVEAFQDFLNNQFKEVRSALINQVTIVEKDLERGQAILKSVSQNIEEVGENQKKIAVLVRVIESQVLPMSLKVCGKDGLFSEGLQLVEVRQMTKNNNQKAEHDL